MSRMAAMVQSLRARTLLNRAAVYRAVFLEEPGRPGDGERVLADLRGYCCAETTTFDPDPHVAARKAGRREVWLRIQAHLNLDDAAVSKLVEVDDDY